MVHFLNEADVQQLLTMDIALEQVERALKARALGKATDVPRQRIQTTSGIQHVLQACAPELGYIGFKYYFTPPGKRGATYVHLINMQTGKLDAIVEGVWLGMMRTGAASGVAARHLANPGATVLAQLGAGYQGMGQLEAVVTALKIKEARVYARTRDKLEAWCKKMADKLGIPVMPATSGAEAHQGRAGGQYHDQVCDTGDRRRLAAARPACQRCRFERTIPGRDRRQDGGALQPDHCRFARHRAQ